LAHLDLPLIVDSTNTRAMEWLREGNSGLALFLAEKQQSGRGRRGRIWISPMARNLTMSLVWPVAGIPEATHEQVVRSDDNAGASATNTQRAQANGPIFVATTGSLRVAGVGENIQTARHTVRRYNGVLD